MAQKKYSCYVIAPVGESDPQLLQEHQNVLDYIIIPALERYDLEVISEDPAAAEKKIDGAVLQRVREADICICDLTMTNPNIYFELGIRDETGRPVILLKKKGTGASPVDVVSRRYVEYDWASFITVDEAQKHLRESVEPLIDQGFERTGSSTSLRDIAMGLSRLERLIDQLGSAPISGTASSAAGGEAGEEDSSPYDRFNYALISRNIPMAEKAMDELQVQMEKLRFYDMVVEQAAAMGSRRAGQMLVEFAGEFMDSSMSFTKKIEYLGSLVSYANRTDSEEENRELIEGICTLLEGLSEGKDPKDVAQICNQRNRLYFGIYGNTGDLQMLERAIAELSHGLRICESSAMYYNLAGCLTQLGEKRDDESVYKQARDAIERAIATSKEDDKDYYEQACRIYHHLGDPKYEDALEKLRKMDPMAASVLERRLGK